jgi:mercuric reductase
VNIGRVPSKALLAAAGVRHLASTNPFPGAPTAAGAVDLAALVVQKDEPDRPRLLIATGAQPAIPDLPGLVEVDALTSTRRWS